MTKGLEALTNMYVLLKLHNLQNDNDFLAIEKELKDLDFIKKCFYVGNSGAIVKTDYGFEHEEKLKEILL